MNINKLGFIGLGNVGINLVNNLINKKTKINVFDINTKRYLKLKNKNIKICNNLKELATSSKIIITCLPSPKAVSNVIEKLLPNIHFEILNLNPK